MPFPNSTTMPSPNHTIMSNSRRNELRVMIVDDSPLVVERIEQVLAEVSAIRLVAKAGTGADAIRGIKQERPDVVILDIQLPGGSGLDVLREAKQLEPAPVVIMFTNIDEPAYRQKCSELGAEFYLEKATQFDELTHVFRLLSKKSRE